MPIGQLPPLTHRVENVRSNKAQRVALWNVVRQYTGHPQLVEWAAKLIREANVPARDPAALARAVQKYAQDHVKFFRERPERFASPLRTLSWGIGDCDDKTILIATVLRSFRIPVRAVFIRYVSREKDGSEKQVSHVFPEFRDTNGQWLALESVHDWAMGDSPLERARKRGIVPIHVETIGP